jgi:hypothetical protein
MRADHIRSRAEQDVQRSGLLLRSVTVLIRPRAHPLKLTTNLYKTYSEALENYDVTTSMEGSREAC